jgi:hypothetical protein
MITITDIILFALFLIIGLQIGWGEGIKEGIRREKKLRKEREP